MCQSANQMHYGFTYNAPLSGLGERFGHCDQCRAEAEDSDLGEYLTPRHSHGTPVKDPFAINSIRQVQHNSPENTIGIVVGLRVETHS